MVRYTYIIVATIIALASCSSEDVGVGGMVSDDVTNTEVATKILHTAIYTSSGQSYVERIQIISDSETYRSELIKYSNEEPSIVDFDTNQILLVDMGGRPNSAYSIDVDSIEKIGDSIQVNVSYVSPPDTCPADDAVSNPFVFLLIDSLLPIDVTPRPVTECRTI